MGSLNCDLCDLGISRIERGRESEFPPTDENIRVGNRGCVLPLAISNQIRTGNKLPYYEQDGNVVEIVRTRRVYYTISIGLTHQRFLA